MAAPQKDLSPTDAIKAATTALNDPKTTSVTLDLQTDGKWTVTVQP